MGPSTLGKTALLAATSLGVGLALAVATLEVGLRMAEAMRGAEARSADGGDATWAMYDEDLVYRLRPGVGPVNEQGLLGETAGAAKGRFRLLVLGDSLGFYGEDAADTYVGRLAARLAAAPDRVASQVLNASTPGYTHHQQIRWLRKYGTAFEPDLVGVGFVLNDLHPVLHSFRIEDGRIVGTAPGFNPEAEASVEGSWIALARRSYAALWLKDRFSVLGRLAELTQSDGYTFEYRPDFANAWKEAPWQAVEKRLAEAVDLAAERDFRLAVWLFPYAQQLRADYLARDRDYVLLPQRRLAEICARLGLPLLDLTPTLGAEDFLPDDVHLTASGRARAAAAIAAFLAERDLVPARSQGAGRQ